MVRADGEAWYAEHHAPSRALIWAGVPIGASAFPHARRLGAPSLAPPGTGGEKLEPPLGRSVVSTVNLSGTLQKGLSWDTSGSIISWMVQRPSPPARWSGCGCDVRLESGTDPSAGSLFRVIAGVRGLPVREFAR